MGKASRELQIVRAGVGILTLKGNKILLGKRKGSHGTDEYCGPGGHVEYGETMEQAILRELAEECGITVKNLRLLCVVDLLTYMPRHYLNVGFVAEWESGEPQALEPDNFASWGWYDIDTALPPLFTPVQAYIEAYKTGRVHFTFSSSDSSNQHAML